jgi:hypothetical protein
MLGFDTDGAVLRVKARRAGTNVRRQELQLFAHAIP